MAPPLSIKSGTEPQESQEKLFIFCDRHDVSPTTPEPGGQLTGMTILHAIDEDNISDEGIIHDEVIRNNEENHHH